MGTYAYLQSGIALSYYKFSVTALPQPLTLADDIGVMFRYQNPQNYYRYSLNSRFGTSRLEKRVGGTFIPLATNSRGFTENQLLQITVYVSGPKIFVFLNNDLVFAVSDSSLTTGSVALYTQERAVFDNVQITAIPSEPIVGLSTPIAYSVNNTNTINATAITLNEPVNGYVEFILDGANPGIIDSIAPYSASFTNVTQGNHTVDARLYDASNTLVSQDQNILVGRSGNYYIAVGDSITNGSGDHYASDNVLDDGLIISFESYEANLTKLLNDSLGYPNIVANEGIGGDDSASAAFVRINSILARNTDANRALVQLGTNDSTSLIPSGLGCTGTACNGTYKGNMQSLINSITATGKQVWIALAPPTWGDTSGVPFANPATATRNTAYIQAYNQVVKTELTNRTVGPDFYNYFLGAGANRYSMFDDTLHPNALGYSVIAHLWHNALNPSAPVALPFVLDNLTPSTVAPYLKQTLVESGDNYYTDEPTYTITDDIPAALTNGRWILTDNANKANTSSNYVSFSVDRAVTVYIAYDAGATALPAWMNGYINTGLTLQTTDPLSPVLNLYSKGFGVGSITLGGNMQSPAAGADSNYSAIVVEN
jgi:lysophospholipase L1-like esterase